MSNVYPICSKPVGGTKKWIIHQEAFWLGGPQIYMHVPRSTYAHPQLHGSHV